MLLFLILGFMTAFVLEDMRYEARIRELTNAGTDTEPQDTGNVPEDTDKPADTQQGNTDPGGNTDDGAGYSEFIRKLADKLALIDALYRYNYLYELDDDALMDSVLKGYVAGTGDLYGAYYNPEEYTEFLNDMNAEFSGLGVHVIFNSDYGLIEVLNVIPGSPAEEAGMLPGDLIYSVMIDGEEVLAYDLGYYPTIGKLRGEEGTEAVFSVYRGEDYSERVDFTIVRRKIDEISVESRVYSLDSTIGIVRISEFDLKTLNQLRAELNKLIDSGCDKYVFDLRYNPGGELTSIINVLDFLLPGGPIVHIVDRAGNEEQVF